MANSDSKYYGIIYSIRHKSSGKIYIGQTVRPLKQRWQEHQVASWCALLHRAIEKYGADAFDVAQIDCGTSKEELDEKEIYWIRFFDSCNRKYGYNLRAGGSFGKHSDESKLKMSKAVRAAQERDPTLTRRRAASRIGKPLSYDIREKIRAANTGKVQDEEVKKRLSETRRRLWSDPELRQKFIEAQNSGKQSEEFKKSQSNTTANKWRDPEMRAKFLAAQAAARNDPIKQAARIAKGRATRAAKILLKAAAA